MCLDFNVSPVRINARGLEPHVHTLPFLVSTRTETLANGDKRPFFDSFYEAQKDFIRNVYQGRLGPPDTRIAPRYALLVNGTPVLSTATTTMQSHSNVALDASASMRPVVFNAKLEKIRVNLLGSDREYGPILYVWTSWGTGRRPIRIAATDDNATSLTSTWSLPLPPVSQSAVQGDARIHFSLYARSRESGLESINSAEAEVIDRIIPIGRTSISLRQLLQDSISGANQGTRLLRFEEPVLNARVENEMIQQLGIKVTKNQRNSIRDKVMRENASGEFNISLPLSVYELGIIAPKLVATMEADATRRFQDYINDASTKAIIPPFEETLLESVYVRAMYPLFLRYSAWFIGDDNTAAVVPPSNDAAASLHLFLWQTPIGALVPARAFWQCIPQLIPYTSQSDHQRELVLFEESSHGYKEMYFSDLLQISLDIDDISPAMFLQVTSNQLADVDGTRVHDWFMTCAAACARVGMLAANAVHYTSDFRFDRRGKQYEDEYWNVDLSSGFGNAGDCENSEQLASMLIRTIVLDKEKWKNPLLQAAARVLELYVMMDIGAVVTAAYVGPSDPVRTGELPIVDSDGDKKSDTGGHCHGLLTPRGIVASQMLRGGASRGQVSDALGSLDFPPWHYRLHSMIVEGTGAIFPYILPLRETFAEHPLEYAFHKKKKELSGALTQQLAFDQAVGFGAYRYPFYDDKPTENRRVSSFYRLFCHGILAIEAVGAPELGKLTFAKSTGGNRFAWGVSAGEYLRDGRSGAGSARLALLSSSLDMREHYRRYVNPYIESVVRQLPLASVGRMPIGKWESLLSSDSSFSTNIKSIRTPLACVLCPPCGPKTTKPDRTRRDDEVLLRFYGSLELKRTAETRTGVTLESLIPGSKVAYMEQLADVALEEGNYQILSQFFSLNTLRRCAIASDELADIFVRGNVWEDYAQMILGRNLYQDTITMRSSFGEILDGTPMYFIIIATDMMRRRNTLPPGRFSPRIGVVTSDFSKTYLELPNAPYTPRKAATLAASLARVGIEVCTQTLPLLGSSTRYHESLQQVRAEITPQSAPQYIIDILENWDAHLPEGYEEADPTIEFLEGLSLDELATLWIDVYASAQWRTKIRSMLDSAKATPRALLAMTYKEIEAYQVPEDPAAPMLKTARDDPSALLHSSRMREIAARAMLIDDAYEAGIKLQTLVNSEAAKKMRDDFFTLSILGYEFEIDEDVARGLVEGYSLNFAYYGSLSAVFDERIQFAVYRENIDSYLAQTSNWGFYRVAVSLAIIDDPDLIGVVDNEKPRNNPEVQLESIIFVEPQLTIRVANLLLINDMVGPTTISVNFRLNPNDPITNVVYPLGKNESRYAAPSRVWSGPSPRPEKISFFAYGWILKSPQYLVPFRKRIDDVGGNDSAFDIFTPLPSTGDTSLRIIVHASKK